MTDLNSAQGSIRVSLFYDVADWAFHNVAQNIKRVSRPPYSIELYSREDWFGVPGKSDSILSESDIAVFLWRFDLLAFLDSLSDKGWDELQQARRCAFVVLVYDHVYANEGDFEDLGNPFDVADGVAASSARLCQHYSQSAYLPDIVHCIPDGVNLELFTPGDAITRGVNPPLRIGWVGNSAWGITLGGDFKGRRSVFEPALDILRSSDLRFTVHIADKAERRVPWHAMPEFYRNLDVLVCSSQFEGTPNPVLEAMACGCAVVSTDVGIVRDILGPRQMQFVMRERSARCLASLLEKLGREPGTLMALKQENLDRRSTLSWHTRWPAWQALFETARSNAETHQGRGAALGRFRTRKKSGLARIRKVIATNRLAFRAYSLLLARSPGLIRWGKRVLSGGRR